MTEVQVEEREPYLQVEFDAIRSAAAVALAARALGHPVTRSDVVAGLIDMWEGCWRRKSAHVTKLAILGYFGADISEVLTEFNFLAPETDGFRAKGAGKYLRIAEGRRAGGHASKGNLIPGARQKKARGELETKPRGSPGEAEVEAQGKPRDKPSGCLSARLGSSSEQRTANSDQQETHTSQLATLWDQEADARLPRWRDVNAKRSKQAAAGLEARALRDGADSWRAVIQRVNRSPFLLGESDRGWTANLDWLLKPGNAAKVLEGVYDSKGGQRTGRASEADRDWSRPNVVDADGQALP